jgi:YVTN family beta-propeller protein
LVKRGQRSTNLEKIDVVKAPSTTTVHLGFRMHRYFASNRSLIGRACVVFCTVCVSAPAFADPILAVTFAEYRVAQRQHLDGPPRWDYLSFDASSKLLYISHLDQVDVYDTVGRTVVGKVTGIHGVHGVALAPELDRGYTSNGRDGSVSVFALSSRQVLATVIAGKNPDAIVYDPASKRVFAANGGSSNVTVIDGERNFAIGNIALNGRPEFVAVDGNGKLFVNLEDKNAIAVIDTTTLVVTARFDISASCDEPAGLSIDSERQMLFVGCRNQKMVIVDATNGRIVDTLPIGRGNDATAFDPSLRRAFSANGDGTLNIFDAGVDGRYTLRQSLATLPGARTMAIDRQSHAIYLMAGEVDHVDAPTLQAPHPRPVLKPDSFTLLTVRPTEGEARHGRPSIETR